MLLAQSLPRLALPSPELLLALTAGLACAGTALVVGRVLLGRRRQPKAAPGPEGGGHDPFVQGSTTEQRQAHRRSQGCPVEVLLAGDAIPEAAPWRGWVVDRSVGGLRLAVPGLLAEGAVVAVRPAAAADAPWTEVEVRSCQAVKDGWEVGCRFLKTPPYAVLLLFG